MQGIRHRFHVGFDGGLRRPVGTAANMLSADQNTAPVDDYLAVELATGKRAKIDEKAVPGIVVSRFGVIPKQGQPNQWRLHCVMCQWMML